VNNKEGVSIVDGTRSNIVYELKEGLQAFSNKRVCVSKLIEFKQSDGVNELTKMIGCFAVFGIYQRRPKLTNRMRKLEIYDGVHYLLEEDDRVSASLEYAKGLRQLTVMVYRHYLANWKAGIAQHISSRKQSNTTSRTTTPVTKTKATSATTTLTTTSTCWALHLNIFLVNLQRW
jgi:hypothetical protein